MRFCYQIENPATGVVLFQDSARSEADALEIMARQAGYRTYAEACKETESDPSELTVTKMPFQIWDRDNECYIKEGYSHDFSLSAFETYEKAVAELNDVAARTDTDIADFEIHDFATKTVHGWDIDEDDDGVNGYDAWKKPMSFPDVTIKYTVGHSGVGDGWTVSDTDVAEAFAHYLEGYLTTQVQEFIDDGYAITMDIDVAYNSSDAIEVECESFYHENLILGALCDPDRLWDDWACDEELSGHLGEQTEA